MGDIFTSRPVVTASSLGSVMWKAPCTAGAFAPAWAGTSAPPSLRVIGSIRAPSAYVSGRTVPRSNALTRTWTKPFGTHAWYPQKLPAHAISAEKHKTPGNPGVL
jgi:hypothetical protein